MLDLYTGFPHLNGNCEKVKEIALLDKSVLENNGTLYQKKNFFPSRIPNIFQNYVIKAANNGIHQFVSFYEKRQKKTAINCMIHEN